MMRTALCWADLVHIPTHWKTKLSYAFTPPSHISAPFFFRTSTNEFWKQTLFSLPSCPAIEPIFSSAHNATGQKNDVLEFHVSFDGASGTQTYNADGLFHQGGDVWRLPILLCGLLRFVTRPNIGEDAQPLIAYRFNVPLLNEPNEDVFSRKGIHVYCSVFLTRTSTRRSSDIVNVEERFRLSLPLTRDLLSTNRLRWCRC